MICVICRDRGQPERWVRPIHSSPSLILKKNWNKRAFGKSISIMDVRKLILVLHRWVGLVTALALLAVGLSAALLVFERPLDRVLNRSLVKVTPAGARLSLNEITRRLAQAYPQYHTAGWTLPQQPDLAIAADLETNHDATPAP